MRFEVPIVVEKIVESFRIAAKKKLHGGLVKLCPVPVKSITLFVSTPIPDSCILCAA
jgi:hypothetical protein